MNPDLAVQQVAEPANSWRGRRVGSVWKCDRFTLDADAHYSCFQNLYATTPDVNGEPIYYQTGPSNTTGSEAETNIHIACGFHGHLNGTLGAAKYQNTRIALSPPAEIAICQRSCSASQGMNVFSADRRIRSNCVVRSPGFAVPMASSSTSPGNCRSRTLNCAASLDGQ